LGWVFPHLSTPALGPTQSPIQWIPGYFPGGKAAGAWRWPPTPSSVEVKEWVGLYIHSPSGTSWPVLGELYLTTESKIERSFASTHPHAFKVCVGIKSNREYVATQKESPAEGTVRTP